MTQKRLTSCLTAWAFVLLVGLPASAQGLHDMQLFAPADLSTYAGGPKANEGYFFAFDGFVMYCDKCESSDFSQRIVDAIEFSNQPWEK